MARARDIMLILGAVGLVIMVSGCTGTSAVQTGNGIVIQDFAPAFAEVYPNEPIIFDLKFKNTGSVKAEDVFAEVMGIDQDWYDPEFKEGGPWEAQEKLPDQPACRYTGEHASLLPPDTQYGTEGQVMTCTWTYRAPNLPPGTKTKYDVWARVFYTYSSTTIKSITAGSQEQIKTYIAQGQTIPVSTVSSTRSPIKLSLETQEPIRYWEDTVTVPIRIGIQNIGDGVPCKKGLCKDREHFETAWGKIDVKLGLSEGMKLSEECAELEKGKELLILSGEQNTVVCNIEISNLKKTGLEQRMISLTADYGYFVDQQTSITVI